MAMRIPPTDYEMRCPEAGVTEEEFHSRKNLREGVNGRDRLNTRFENTQRSQVLAPRGDKRGRPMPRDAGFAEAGNHGEWGPDKFEPALEYGMDGPDSKELMKGYGLPTTRHWGPSADPTDLGAEDCFGDRPMGQGVGKKEM